MSLPDPPKIAVTVLIDPTGVDRRVVWQWIADWLRIVRETAPTPVETQFAFDFRWDETDPLSGE